jgi:uncharacterized Zn finger protein (UPF0148 family)
MGLFSRAFEQNQTCQRCGTTFRGVPDGFPYCGRCLETAREQADRSTAAQITEALRKRASRF